MPTFLVIGAARSGTTALYMYLKQHPEIFMSASKETNFFAFENEVLDCMGPGADYINNSITSLSDYQCMFEGYSGKGAAGEASPLYLFSQKAPAQIHHHIPEVKLVAILRNPVEQAFSHFLYARRQMLEPLDDFLSALQAEKQRKKNRWMPLFQYSQFPKYHLQLQRYFELFSDHQIKIFTYEEFQQEPQRVMRDVFSFIGIDKGFIPNFDYRPNAGGVPRNRMLQSLLMKPHRATKLAGYLVPEEIKRRIRDAVSDRNLVKPEISPEAKHCLMAELRDDILNLQELMNRDLSAWLQ